MRTVLPRVQLSFMVLALLGACGDDPAPAPGPKVGDKVDTNGDGVLDGTYVDVNFDGTADGVDTTGDNIPEFNLTGGPYVPPVTGDGSTNADGSTADGSTADGDPAGCQTGSTQACTCEDGTSQGTQLCVGGVYGGACQGCPCQEGSSQACTCGAQFGEQICMDGQYGTCECETTSNPTACPAGTTCGTIGGGLVPQAPPACLDQGGIAPPACETNEDCTTKGFAMGCLNNPFAFPPFVPAKVCLQTCTAGTTGDGSSGDGSSGGDAGI